ncbi:hypothetical protein N5F13_25200 [Comamonas thiooxydans]|uniref:hypothetical protein n=1 Tax=Comamonas thiooxydans TaxID=363952 RepID=UPI00244B9F9F|nr:hypothetical protein [Comamonas thiooxydans]MDH1477785.1 hypothetical protein [Comamonas thiooxydans]
MQDKITIADAPDCLNTNDKAMWVLGYQAALAARSTCLHQIQEPAAAEQAAWHAGLDEGRAQAAQPEDARELVTLALGLSLPPKGGPSFAWSYLLSSIRELVKCEEELTLLKAGMEMSKAAPTAVAVPDGWKLVPCEPQNMQQAAGAQAIRFDTTLISKMWTANKVYREMVASAPECAALAATPAAAPGKLGDDMQMRCRKCGEQVKIEFNSARIVTHNQHTGKPRDARDVESDPEGKLIVAPGPLFAAAAPVVRHEPDAVISELMGLVDEWGMESHLRGEAELDAQHSEATQEEIDCAKDRASKERAAWKAIESKLRALLATATGLPAQAVRVANCYSDDEGDTWRDCPDDCEFVEGRALGEEFELQASIRSWTEVFRVTKVPDETSDDYEVEPVSIRTSAAPQAQADARDAESDYQRGYRHGYNRRDAEVQGALL